VQRPIGAELDRATLPVPLPLAEESRGTETASPTDLNPLERQLPP